MEKERITFLDYVRVFACFLVILVHASENYYGAPDATDMVGPTSYLANEADRLWVSVYDGFSRMSVPLFMIVSAFLLAPMSEKITSWEFYKKRFMRILPPFFVFFVLYSTLPMAWGQIGWDTASKDLSRLLLNFPTLAGHFWFMYPLISIYLIIPVVSPWLRKATAAEERFFLLLFAISTCIPFLNRFCGEVWGQCFWNEYHMLWYFSGYLGYLVMAHYIRTHLTWSCTRKLTVGAIALVAGAVGT
ncbi:MAG: acyltransferase, partial [Bacteroidaceae bacterium]|nr:acyltransferase [Bacteroidaceae bacterium]